MPVLHIHKLWCVTASKLAANAKPEMECHTEIGFELLFVVMIDNNNMKLKMMMSCCAGYLDALGNAMLTTCRAIPNGVLCFFPSWGLLNAARDQWLVTGKRHCFHISHVPHGYPASHLPCNTCVLGAAQ